MTDKDIVDGSDSNNDNVNGNDSDNDSHRDNVHDRGKDNDIDNVTVKEFVITIFNTSEQSIIWKNYN